MTRRTRSAIGAAVLLLGGVVLAIWILRDGGGGASQTLERDAPAPAQGTGPRAARARSRADSAVDRVEEAPPTAAAPAPVAGAAASFEYEPTFAWTVKVLRADGVPAAGATVVLLADDGEGDWSREVAHVTADAGGTAALRVAQADTRAIAWLVAEPTVRAIAWLGAEAAATREVISATEERSVTLRLGPAIRLRGRVVRADGAAEPGAAVELDATPWFRSYPGLAISRTSDAAGVFEFPPIPLEGIDPLNPPQVDATTADQACGFAEADLEHPDAEILVRLQPGWTVRARFLDAEGKPVAAELRAAGPRVYRAKTDAQGRVALRVPPGGRFTFIALRDTGRLVRCPPAGRELYSEVWFLAQSLGRREHDARGDVDLGDVVLAPGRPVVGHVVDTSGRPTAQARVVLRLGDVVIGSVLSEATGRFELPEVSDEPHRLDVRAERTVRDDEAGPDESSSRLAAHATVEGVRGGDPELRVVVIDVLTIALRFLAEADRAPVRLTDVRVVVRPHGASTGTQTQCTDTTDRLAVRVLEPGRYDVDLTVGGYEPWRAENVEVLADRPAVLDVVLRRTQE